MDLKTLELIVALAEEKSVVSAAERLNIPIKDVETFCNDFRWETKTSFLDKAFMNRFVSSQGMEVHEKAKQILNDIENFDKWMNSLRSEPAGDITIVTMPFVGTEWLMPKLKTFLQEYPKVKIKLVLKNPPIQAGEGDIVISIPLVGPKSFFRSWKVSSATYGLYASPEYLKEHGTPKVPEDLEHHRLISFKGYIRSHGYFDWSLVAGLKSGRVPRTPYFEVDSLISMVSAVKSGIGIAELPNPNFAKKSEDLVRVLPSLRSPVLTLCCIFERDRENTPLIRKLYQHIRDDSIKERPEGEEPISYQFMLR